MPNDLRLRVGAATGTITFNPALSDAQVANALRRYARSLGISVDGTPQENLTAILQHWLDDVKRRSKAVQLADLAAERAASDAATTPLIAGCTAAKPALTAAASSSVHARKSSTTLPKAFIVSSRWSSVIALVLPPILFLAWTRWASD